MHDGGMMMASAACMHVYPVSLPPPPRLHTVLNMPTVPPPERSPLGASIIIVVIVVIIIIA